MDPEMMMAMQQGGAPAGPMDPAMMGAPEPDGDALIMALMQAVMGGIQGKEAEADADRESLAQMLMMMLSQQQGPAVDPLAGYAEGSQAPVAEAPLG